MGIFDEYTLKRLSTRPVFANHDSSVSFVVLWYGRAEGFGMTIQKARAPTFFSSMS
jgi:hypothetical protein